VAHLHRNDLDARTIHSSGAGASAWWGPLCQLLPQTEHREDCRALARDCRGVQLVEFFLPPPRTSLAWSIRPANMWPSTGASSPCWSERTCGHRMVVTARSRSRPLLGYKSQSRHGDVSPVLAALSCARCWPPCPRPNLFAAQTALQALLPIALDRDSGAPSPWSLLSIAQRLLGCTPVLICYVGLSSLGACTSPSASWTGWLASGARTICRCCVAPPQIRHVAWPRPERCRVEENPLSTDLATNGKDWARVYSFAWFIWTIDLTMSGSRCIQANEWYGPMD
jgi:hypothetical protein